MSKNTISPANLMKAAAQQASKEVQEPQDTDVAQEKVKVIGPAYRLPSAPSTIIYKGTRHIYPDGIVRCLTEEFHEFMQTLVASGGAIILSEEQMPAIEAEIKSGKVSEIQ